MTNRRTESQKGDVLVVDDTPANLRLLTQMLLEQGYFVRPVPDGALAIAAVQAEPPDLILLDIRMPGMDGYAVCEHLKADPQTRDIPIIFISALDDLQDKIKAFTAGGVDYVTKPFQVEEVVARVETHLALRNLQKALQDANRKMAQELCLAGEVQTSFLPRDLPDIPGIQIAATLKPARETSGDFYDFIILPGGELGIVIADVSDKGAGAALYLALSCTLIRTFAVEYPGHPEKVLSLVNRRILKDTTANDFVTVFYGILDPVNESLVYCNAGHMPPYLFGNRSSEKFRKLGKTGLPLGIAGTETWEQGVVQFAPGDVLMLYTDGITEAQNGQGEFFGEDLLLACVSTNLRRTAGEIQDAILTDVQRFVGDTSQSDDITMMVLLRDSLKHVQGASD